MRLLNRCGLAAATTLAATAALHLPARAGDIAIPCPDNGWGHLPRWVPGTTAAGDSVGRAVDTDGETAVLGAPGGDAVHVYQRTGSTWSFLQTIDDPNGTGNDFGMAVEVEGELMIVGAPADPSDGPSSGVAHTFERIGGVWAFSETLHDPTPNDFSKFGTAVGVSGSWAAVGAPGDGAGGTVNVYLRTFTSWQHHNEMDYTPGGEFGSALAIREVPGQLKARLFVGAWGDNPAGSNSGSVRAFTVAQGVTWIGASYSPPGLNAGDYFGADLAFDGQTLVVGAYGDDTAGTNAGAIYILDIGYATEWASYDLDSKRIGCLVSDLHNFGRSVDIDQGRIAAGAPNQEPGGRVHVFYKAPWATDWAQEDRLFAADGQLDDDFGWDVAVAGEFVLVGARRADAPASQGGAGYLVSLQSNDYPGGLLPSQHLATIDYYGTGKPGTLGTPGMLTLDPPVAGESQTVRIVDGLPGALPFLIWGLVPAAIPFDAGTLLIGDPHVIVMPTIGVVGTSPLIWTLPSAAGLLGADVYMQAMFFDPLAGGALKTAQTNGLQLTIGY